MTKRTLRSADEHSKSIECYLKSDIEKRSVELLSTCTSEQRDMSTVVYVTACVGVDRALEVWGSWQVLEHELKRRRHLAEEEERRRQGLGALIAQLKKYNRAQTRKEIDVEVCYTPWCLYNKEYEKKKERSERKREREGWRPFGGVSLQPLTD